MSVRQSPARRRALVAFALVTAAVSACDRSVTAPGSASPASPASPALRPVPARPAAIEGDTLKCTRGWVIVTGTYVCNEDL